MQISKINKQQNNKTTKKKHLTYTAREPLILIGMSSKYPVFVFVISYTINLSTETLWKSPLKNKYFVFRRYLLMQQLLSIVNFEKTQYQHPEHHHKKSCPLIELLHHNNKLSITSPKCIQTLSLSGPGVF